jgi:hypothetical protein
VFSSSGASRDDDNRCLAKAMAVGCRSPQRGQYTIDEERRRQLTCSEEQDPLVLWDCYKCNGCLKLDISSSRVDRCTLFSFDGTDRMLVA